MVNPTSPDQVVHNLDEDTSGDSELSVTPLPITMWGPPAAKVNRGPGWRHVALGGISALAFSVIYSSIVSVVVGADHPEYAAPVLAARVTEMLSTTGPGILGGLLSLWAGFLSGVAVAGRSYAGGWKKLVGWTVRWRVDVPLALLLTLGVQGVTVVAGLVVNALHASSTSLGNTGEVTGVTGGWLPFVLVLAAVCAPIVEELFFRGLVLSVAVRSWGPAVGVVVSALLFGAMHVQSTFASSVYTVTMTAVFGAALAIVRLRTGRLGSTILAHIVFNTAGLAIALIAGK